MQKNTYFDYAATTPLNKKVATIMEPYFFDVFGNPSSVHAHGKSARAGVAEARERIGRILGAKAHELIFTSSGTEANNLALIGIAEAHGFLGHICVSAIEHHSVLETAHYLETRGIAVTYMPVDAHGVVSPKTVRASIRPDTFLVSVQMVNNEIGTREPIADIGKEIGALNRERKTRIYMHTDAVQAAGMYELLVDRLHVDMLTLSAHKLYGPKGVGMLYVKNNTPLLPQTHGGGQERNRRSGTENVPGIVGMAQALEIAEQRREAESARVCVLRDVLRDAVCKAAPKVVYTGHPTERAPHIASFCFPNFEGDALVALLSEAGFSCSSGSACTTGNFEPSHVLTALGLETAVALGSVRVSLGRETRKKDIERLVKSIVQIVNK